MPNSALSNNICANTNSAANRTTAQPKIHALIVAAGKGSRFGASVPKQYLDLAGRSVLEHSVKRLNHAEIRDLTLVVAADDERVHSLDFEFAGKIDFAIGGDERWQSVHSGVAHIRASGAGDDDWVLVHDAARPCLPAADLQAIITASHTCTQNALMLATPVVDTLKLAQDEQVVRTVDRQNLWQAQTPQMFRLAALEKVLAAVSEQGLMITDEASGFELLGEAVQVVAGSRLNMKLTFAGDLPLLSLIAERLLADDKP
ncbi:2-C-methyl-D-erythritol 4-phosphate cytidylyltransferase [Moraxella caviae]|uniref:2-C-methyl-D-erythritol 4-phosphate cytidylyltransferase n=2 Tax=Moraxella caviae TaxID=34060 RepID=A0A378R811_9GAMM|nr:2-C-methyl-D-erythritol 4-phosphate cytidylyltransferase [Moraxella caviae]STZ10050.1 2-C-methyl-D-erythritol 4-phosphate cytidylyltransferase [Moraxella caviae]VEW12759.1 2-C-methyl-D-erythritol 4-phosphate cytidylyltransferase [Moraxella caviae]